MISSPLNVTLHLHLIDIFGAIQTWQLVLSSASSVLNGFTVGLNSFAFENVGSQGVSGSGKVQEAWLCSMLIPETLT